MEFAPLEIINYAKSKGATNVYFVDDKNKCKRSIRYLTNIWINTRCTFWDAMIQPPFSCRTAHEAILMRFLHEVGHISLNHPGDNGLVSTTNGLIVPKIRDIYTDAFSSYEGEAWEFALKTRKIDTVTYNSLLETCHDWYVKHKYKEKDWEDNNEAMWLRIQKFRLVEAHFNIPDWVISRYGKYQID